MRLLSHATMSRWHAFGYGVAVGLGYELLRFGVNGAVDTIIEASIGDQCCRPPSVSMRTVAIKRKILESESEFEQDVKSDQKSSERKPRSQKPATKKRKRSREKEQNVNVTPVETEQAVLQQPPKLTEDSRQR